MPMIDVVAAHVRARWALDRRVRLTAGPLVATTVAASFRWPPARYLAGLIGAGLAIAAVTNTCALGMPLSRLPHNWRPRRAGIASVVPSGAHPDTRG